MQAGPLFFIVGANCVGKDSLIDDAMRLYGSAIGGFEAAITMSKLDSWITLEQNPKAAST